MAVIFTQTDTDNTAVSSAETAACSGRVVTGASGLPTDRECSEGATPGVGNATWRLLAEETDKVIAAYVCVVDADVTWSDGTWTVRFNVTTENKNLTVTEIYICRVDSAGANQETIGSATGLSISLSTTGVKEQSVTGIAVTQTAGDLVVISIVGTNGAMTTQSAAITNDQNIDSPFTVASAALTGTISPTATEAEIVAGGETLIITLTGDTWVASGATFDAERSNIIDGCDSAQSETNGWDAVVKAGQSDGGVIRTSDTVCTITWDAFATYDITATETITVTIPATALTAGVAIVATPTFTVTATGVAGTGWGPLIAGRRNVRIAHV